ncbi:hypothetical protein AB4376_18755 [Vibrio breoganii]
MPKKIKLKPIKPHTLYFLSIDEFAEFLGINVSARSKLNWYEAVMGKLRISDRSKDNLGRAGISPRLAMRVMRPILRFMYKKNLLRNLKKYPRNIEINDVIHAWLSALESFSMEDKYLDTHLLVKFLEDRNEKYQDIKIFIDDAPTLTPENEAQLLTQYFSLMATKTLLNSEEQQAALKIVKRKNKEVLNLSDFHKTSFFKLIFDFHLSIYSVIDLILLSSFHKVEEYQSGFFSTLFDVEGETYFGKLLNHITAHTDSSDYKLAKYIQIKRKEEQERNSTIHEVQLSTLQDWKSGKTKPTPSTLKKFYECIADDSDEEFDYLPVIIISMLCIALDKKCDSLKTASDLTAFKAVFSTESYTRYFHSAKARML